MPTFSLSKFLPLLIAFCLLPCLFMDRAGAATMTAAASTAQGGGIVTAVPVNGVMPLFPLLGVGTTFSATPPTLSGVAGCSVSSPVYTDATHETFTLTTGSATGTLTITDPTTGATTTVTVSPEPTNVVYNQNFDGLTVGTSAGWTNAASANFQVRNTFAYAGQVPFSGANMFGVVATVGDKAIYTGMPAAGDMQELYVQPIHLSSSGPTITGSDTLDPVLRSSAGFSSLYEFSNTYGINVGGGNVSDYSLPGFAQTLSTNITTMPRQLVEGDYVWTRAESVGSVIRIKVWLNAQAEPTLWTSTAIDTHVTAAGYAGLYSGHGNAVIDNLTIYSSVPLAITMAVAPSALTAGTTGNTVTLTGTATSWTSGTTFSVGGGTGASITATSVNAGTQIATLTVSPGTTGGTLTYSENADTATATQTVTANPLTVAATSSGVFYSPYNWYSVAGVSAQTNNPGAYFKTTFTGTSFVLKTDSTDMQTYGISAPNNGNFQWSVDGGPFQTANLPNGVNTTSLASGLAAGTHSLVFYNYYNFGGNRWGTGGAGQIGVADQLKITGFVLDAGSTLNQPTLQVKRAIFYGDSITQGRRAINASDTSAGDDAIHNYSGVVAAALGAEYGQIGYGSQGWEQGGDGAVPNFFTVGDSTNSAWDKLFVGQSRLTAGLFSPAPDYIFENEGANGTGGTTPARVQGWLAAARTAAPLAKIFCVIAFGGGNRGGVTSGFAAYQSATPDSSAFLIDLGNQPGISGPIGTPSLSSPDNLHPYAVTHGSLGALLASAVRLKTAAVGGTKRRIQ